MSDPNQPQWGNPGDQPSAPAFGKMVPGGQPPAAPQPWDAQPAAPAQPWDAQPAAPAQPWDAAPVHVPAAAGQAGTSEPILFMVGDIGITQNWVITPNGSAPLAGSQWIGRDMSRTEKKTPTWAIVLAILLFLACLLGLFFLLVKEEVTTGYFEVSVQSGSVRHVTQLPVSSPSQLMQLRQAVHQAQSMAAGHR